MEGICINDTCTYVPRADGVVCTTAADGYGECDAGACVAVGLCANVTCPDSLPFCFEKSTCNPKTGLCTQVFKPAGTPCDDGQVNN